MSDALSDTKAILRCLGSDWWPQNGLSCSEIWPPQMPEAAGSLKAKPEEVWSALTPWDTFTPSACKTITWYLIAASPVLQINKEYQKWDWNPNIGKL